MHAYVYLCMHMVCNTIMSHPKKNGYKQLFLCK